MNLTLRHIVDDQELGTAFVLMQELRPHLTDVDTFIAQVRRQAEQHYRLLGLWQEGTLQALAGYRLQENLLYGRFLYVDDLITVSTTRGQGLGAKLLDALKEEARGQQCAWFVLDTALGNALGQRFYYRQGLLGAGMHFRQPL